MHGGKNGLHIATVTFVGWRPDPRRRPAGGHMAGMEDWRDVGQGSLIKLSQGLTSGLNDAGNGFSHWENGGLPGLTNGLQVLENDEVSRPKP
jgi:hypothetical protein